MKHHDGNREAAESVSSSDGILAIERAPYADCDAANDEKDERPPPSCANTLTTEAEKQSQERPDAQSKKNDGEQSVHAAGCGLTKMLRGAGPSAFECKQKRKSGIHSIRSQEHTS